MNKPRMWYSNNRWWCGEYTFRWSTNLSRFIRYWHYDCGSGDTIEEALRDYQGKLIQINTVSPDMRPNQLFMSTSGYISKKKSLWSKIKELIKGYIYD